MLLQVRRVAQMIGTQLDTVRTKQQLLRDEFNMQMSMAYQETVTKLQDVQSK